jgi:hypothetical protein
VSDRVNVAIQNADFSNILLHSSIEVQDMNSANTPPKSSLQSPHNATEQLSHPHVLKYYIYTNTVFILQKSCFHKSGTRAKHYEAAVSITAK